MLVLVLRRLGRSPRHHHHRLVVVLAIAHPVLPRELARAREQRLGFPTVLIRHHSGCGLYRGAHELGEEATTALLACSRVRLVVWRRGGAWDVYVSWLGGVITLGLVVVDPKGVHAGPYGACTGAAGDAQREGTAPGHEVGETFVAASPLFLIGGTCASAATTIGASSVFGDDVVLAADRASGIQAVERPGGIEGMINGPVEGSVFGVGRQGGHLFLATPDVCFDRFVVLANVALDW